jgi:membrane protein YqaA with SNARE-associated domain
VVDRLHAAANVSHWLHSLFVFFLSWWGALLLSFLDSTLLFVIPFGNDALLIYLAARTPELFWLYALLMTIGSVGGVWLTYRIGQKAGDEGLPRLVSPNHLDRLKERANDAGAGTVAIAAVLPPPFPLTPFVLTCGALHVNRTRLLVLFAVMRLLRFGTVATVARWYGTGVLKILHSTVVERVVIGLIVVAIAGTVISGILLWRRTRQPQHA